MKTSILTSRAAVVMAAAAGVLGAGAAAFLQHPLPAAAAAGGGAAMAAALQFGVLPSAGRRAANRARLTSFPRPRRRWIPGGGPRKAVDGAKGKKGRDSAGRYPLKRDAFLVAPHILVGLVAPHAGAASGATITEHRAASPLMLDPTRGMKIGVAGPGAGSPVYLSARDLPGGIMANGRQGSGKSNLLHALYGFFVLERVSPSGLPGRAGARNTLIAIESKGSGPAKKYIQWARTLGDKVKLIEVNDPATFAVDMFDRPDRSGRQVPLKERVRSFAGMLVYAFPDGSIQGRGFDAVTAMLTGALVVNDVIAERAKLPAGRSPMFYAHVLLGGSGDQKGVDLFLSLVKDAASAAKSDPNSDLALAADALAPFYGPGRTQAARAALTESARARIGELLALDKWWDPARPKVGWKQIIESHSNVVINCGEASNGEFMDARLREYICAMLMFSLKQAIERLCGDWIDDRRFVTIFSDELKLLAPDDPGVIGWLHDAGRSFGVIPVFAAQRLGQLSDEIQESILDYSTVVWFRQSNAGMAAVAAADLNADNSGWETADIIALEQFTAVVRTHVGDVRQPGVPVRLTNFEADIENFAEEQGYPPSRPRRTQHRDAPVNIEMEIPS